MPILMNNIKICYIFIFCEKTFMNAATFRLVFNTSKVCFYDFEIYERVIPMSQL